MSLHPPRLSDRRAQMRPAAPSGAARRMLPISLHAVFAALFARIFARLEHLLLLWQTGQLPTPAPRQPTTRQPAAGNPPLRAQPARHAGHRPHPRIRPAAARPVIPRAPKDRRILPHPRRIAPPSAASRPRAVRRSGLYLSDRCPTGRKTASAAIAQPHPNCYELTTKTNPALRPARTSANIPP